MKKIFVLVGAVFLLVVILSAWIFIGGFGNYAYFLGDQTTSMGSDEKARFLGSWEQKYDGSNYVFKSDGTFIKDFVDGTYDIKENQHITILYPVDFVPEEVEYVYSFSSDDTILSLMRINSDEDEIVLEKIL